MATTRKTTKGKHTKSKTTRSRTTAKGPVHGSAIVKTRAEKTTRRKSR